MFCHKKLYYETWDRMYAYTVEHTEIERGRREKQWAMRCEAMRITDGERDPRPTCWVSLLTPLPSLGRPRMAWRTIKLRQTNYVTSRACDDMNASRLFTIGRLLF